MKTKTKKDKYGYKNLIADTRYMLGFIWESDKSLFFLKGLYIIIESLMMVIGVLFLKVVIDMLTSQAELVNIVIFVIAVQIITFALNFISHTLNGRIIPKKEYILRNNLQNIFIRKSMKHDLSVYEDSDFYKKYTVSMRIADSKAIEYLNKVTELVQAIVNLIAIVAIIATLDIFVIIMAIIMTAVSAYDYKKTGRLGNELYKAEININRVSDYVKKVAHHRQFAKDVRLYDMGGFLLGKLKSVFTQKYRLFSDMNKKYWRMKEIGSFVNLIILNPILLVYLAYQAYHGLITIGSLSVLFGSCFDLVASTSAIPQIIDRLKFEGEFFVGDLRTILDYEPTIEKEVDGKLDIKPDEINDIEFRNVIFKYPNYEQTILNNVNFKINKGEKVAIVGKNGAGKTTIIKLVMRLYDVTDGEILINGVNISEYNIKQLRKCFSSIMQDFNVYAFTVAENILLSEYDETMHKRVNDSLNFSGLHDDIMRCKDAEKSYITREFEENGIELSGGQNQKLALARAYGYLENPSVYIMDEPNSALDPLAEYDLNQQLLDISSDSTTLIITHRLSTTAMCSKIMLIDNGSLAEIGSHTDLLKKNGLYAEMFNRQAKAYEAREEGL